MVLVSVKVSFIALGVIFLVLSLLIVLIEILVRLIPYEAPPAPGWPTGAAPGDEDEHIAAIHAAVAHHLGASPDSIQITNVRSLP